MVIEKVACGPIIFPKYMYILKIVIMQYYVLLSNSNSELTNILHVGPQLVLRVRPVKSAFAHRESNPEPSKYESSVSRTRPRGPPLIQFQG